MPNAEPKTNPSSLAVDRTPPPIGLARDSSSHGRRGSERDCMGSDKRALTTSTGRIGEELIEVPDNYIQPTRNDKQKVQAGYLDLLYYEYRREVASHVDSMGVLFLVIAVLVLMFQAYVGAVAIVLAVLGTLIMAGNRRKSKEFSGYRRSLERELLRLGVGVEDDQLSKSTISSTAWGELRQYAVSGLGIVRPVSKKGYPEDLLYVFNVFEDKVYR